MYLIQHHEGFCLIGKLYFIYDLTITACLSQHVALLQNWSNLISAVVDNSGSIRKYPEVNTSSHNTAGASHSILFDSDLVS